MAVHLAKIRATRWIQPAGSDRERPLRWRYGVAMRVPGHRLFIVTFGRGRT